MQTTSQPSVSSPWYFDWQNPEHARHFDERSRLGKGALIRNYESFNDVRLLGKRLSNSPGAVSLLEVGCATGEFSRYLAYQFPSVGYTGIDVSQSALKRATEKYPQGRFRAADPARTVLENFQVAGMPGRPQWVYSKDVLHHQVEPWDFLHQLLDAAGEGVVLRTRTRERGATVLDPNLSCQYHYDGWMPYIVINRDELVQAIHQRHPEAEVALIRNPMVLGGRENRFLPKECYLPETGTAETAVGIFLKSGHPGRVKTEDRPDGAGQPAASWLRKLWS